MKKVNAFKTVNKPGGEVVYLKDVGTKAEPCWVPCAKGDKGAVAFVQK